jgi:hypothetical protein
MDSKNVRLLSASDMALLSQSISQIKHLVPSARPLNGPERRALFKLSQDRLEFVEQAFQKMKTNPSLVPSYLDLTSAQRLLHLYQQLTEVSEQVQKLQEQIENTKLQAGNQALLLSKMFYHQTKNAATLGLKDAKDIATALHAVYTVGRNAKTKRKARQERLKD